MEVWSSYSVPQGHENWLLPVYPILQAYLSGFSDGDGDALSPMTDSKDEKEDASATTGCISLFANDISLQSLSHKWPPLQVIQSTFNYVNAMASE